MSEFWEPWVPSVGQRVRYLYQPECPGVYGARYPVGHPPEYDRLAGTVYEIFTCGLGEARNGHRFLTQLDDGDRCIMAAALELEPLDP